MAPNAAPHVILPLLTLGLLISTVSDLRSRLIYDVVTFPLFGLALASRALLCGWAGEWGLSSGLLGALLGFGAFLIPVWRGGMGMGDLKLATAVGAAVGWERTPAVLLSIALVGGALALVTVVQRGVAAQTLRRTAALLLPSAVGRRLQPEVAPPIYLPYGVAIALGTAAALLLGGRLLP